MTHRPAPAPASLLSFVLIAIAIGCVVEDDLGDRPEDHAGTASGGQGSDDTGAEEAADTGSGTAADEDNAPVFTEPLAAGLVHEQSSSECIEIPLVVVDPDDTRVEISVTGSPDGATLDQDMDLSARWKWCPRPDPVDEGQYPLTFIADDGDNEPVVKDFLVQVRP